VHHGRFFTLLANLRLPAERAFAVDVFDDQHLNPDKSGRGDLSILESNIKKYGHFDGVQIIQKNSLELTRADFYPQSEGGVRLFSVDGSHTAKHTFSDLEVSSKLVSPKGLIILDDFYNPDWPGVQEGFHRFLQKSNNKIAPVAYGNNKLFLCHRNIQQKYLGFVENDLKPHLTHYKQVQIGNYRVAHIRLPDPELVFRQDLSLAQNVFSLRGPTFSARATLENGWSAPNLHGIWTVGPSAGLRLQLKGAPGDETTLVIWLEPFLHSQRMSRELLVNVNGRSLGRFLFKKDKPGRLEVSLPPGLLTADCSIQFGIEEPERPSEILGTIDKRPLGFLLREIRIIGFEAGDPAAIPS
jgi:hypothetical protein